MADDGAAQLASTVAVWDEDLPHPPASMDSAGTSNVRARRVSGEIDNREERRASRRRERERGAEPAGRENKRDHYQVTSATVSLLPPISFTMLLVVILIKIVPDLTSRDNSEGEGFLGVNVEASTTDTAAAQASGATLQALIVIGFVIVMTTVLVVCVKLECYRALATYLGLMLFLLLGYFSYQLIVQFCAAVNLACDWPALIFVCWNYLAAGLLALGAGKMPLRVMQFYHITLSAIMACQFMSFLGFWATWAMLFLMAIWDLIAVLCPYGPLRLLIEMTEEKGISVPDALIYSTSLEEHGGGGGGGGGSGRKAVAHLPGLGLTANGDGAGAGAGAGDDNARYAEEGGSSGGGGGAGAGAGAVSSIPGLGIGDGSSNTRRHNQGDLRVGLEAGIVGQPNTSILDIMRDGGNAGGDHRASNRSARQHGADGSAIVAQHNASIEAERRAEEEEDEERSGPKLGLGDFIFYSVLMALTAQKDDWGAVLACYLSIILGLTATLWILILHGKALPALPIPLFIAIIMYFSVDLSITPMVERLQLDCVFI